MQKSVIALLMGMVALPLRATSEEAPQAGALGTITVSAGRARPFTTAVAATTEGIDAEQVDSSINASDSEDALKYLPSLNVRKRYAGDFDHAVLASRASGSGNSARSLVYADGILLSNLLGNGAAYAPRWGLVTPGEIARVDVLYGPYSAAYSGNSAGVVVQYATRMPERFEADARLAVFSQAFAQYGSAGRHDGRQAEAALGDRSGAWSWRLHLGRLDSDGQPLTFANRLLASGTPGGGGVPVSGALAAKNPAGRDWLVLGDGGQVRTLQDSATFRVAHAFSDSLSLSYTLGAWRNAAARSASSYLRDAAGAPVTGSDAQPLVNIDGRTYRLAPADFAPNRSRLAHRMQGLALKGRTDESWHWQLAASRYDYADDVVRMPSGFAGSAGSPGTITDLQGSGWQTLAFTLGRRIGAHEVDAGLQEERFRLRTRVSAAADWLQGGALQTTSVFNGDTGLRSLYLQDGWTFAPRWKALLGGRLEQWRAFGGEIGNAARTLQLGERRETRFSPKVSLAFAAAPEWTLKAALGRAVRNPTVAELYQGSLSGNAVVNNDPYLRPEQGWSGELTAEHALAGGLLRASWFAERMDDALYAQTNVTVVPNVTNIQNVGRIRTQGLELAAQADDAGVRGLDLSGSLTWTDSVIVANPAFPQSVGKRQPRVPRWRATALASLRVDADWTASLGVRYSGRQYGTLDNSDPNGDAYTGFSDYLVSDLRLRYQPGRQWSAALGVDNLNNAKYWAFHPYAQRSVRAELRWRW